MSMPNLQVQTWLIYIFSQHLTHQVYVPTTMNIPLPPFEERKAATPPKPAERCQNHSALVSLIDWATMLLRHPPPKYSVSTDSPNTIPSTSYLPQTSKPSPQPYLPIRHTSYTPLRLPFPLSLPHPLRASFATFEP
ncbi:hypothetical protein BDR22DRAFT_845563 [Usnea florida]